MCVDRHGQVELSIAFETPVHVGWWDVLEHVEYGEYAAEEIAERERR